MTVSVYHALTQDGQVYDFELDGPVFGISVRGIKNFKRTPDINVTGVRLGTAEIFMNHVT